MSDLEPVKYSKGYLVLAALSVLALIALLFSVRISPAHDQGQWDTEHYDPAIVQWYQTLMQPDAPASSCCGEADAYWCDDYRFEGGKALCTISDDRPDAPRGRPHVAVGTVIEIPNNKLKWDRSNPTGHGVVFLNRGGYVFCFVQPGGV